MLLAAPLTALPPVVLFETSAEPDVACCVVELLTLTLLLLVTVAIVVPEKVILFNEDGPVLLIDPELEPPLPLFKTALEDEEFESERLARVLLVLLAAPLIALPPVVLFSTSAVPVLEF
ncbi:MAG: hypothetical protein ACMG55_07500 [Microcoleus sp.]